MEGSIFSPFGKVPLFPPLEKGAGGFNEGGARTMQNKSSIDEKAKSRPTFTLQKGGGIYTDINFDEIVKSPKIVIPTPNQVRE